MPQNKAEPTDADLVRAHAECDAGALVRYYTLIADRRDAEGNIDAACFYLTQAYVIALEAGHAETARLHARLVAQGREE